MVRRLPLLALALCMLANTGRAEVATVSFGAGKQAAYPERIKADRTIQIDLSAIPKIATVFRAVLRPGRDNGQASQERNQPVKITHAGNDAALPLLPPRFNAFDVTNEVRQAVQSGEGKVAFTVVSFPGYVPGQTRLDVTASVQSPKEIPAVKGLRAWHRAGQTFLTWAEVDPPVTADEITFQEWKAMRAKQGAETTQVRYRIYRDSKPITSATIGQAELVDEIGPLSCWNPDYYGISPRGNYTVPRYAVEDGKEPVAPGTGIYVHNPRLDGTGYYAVSVAVNGAEDLSKLGAGSTTSAPVNETVGLGTPVLQRIVKPKQFNYVTGPTLHYFVRWEAPPRCNMPSRPYDYLVALPAKLPKPAPVGLHLHCWGANLNGGYGWWYNAAQGAVLLSTNQLPYDWWTGYHEHMGTWKSWSQGVIRDYTQQRVLGFLDWADTRWDLDKSRIFTAGNSMGGSGSPNLGIRYGDRIVWTVSWVGVHTPARTPQFRGSYEGVYGLLKWQLPFQDGKTPAFTYFDDAWFVRQHPRRETPLICFANGKNDGAIGWPQARDFWKALQETRRPHVFIWGQAGHGQRAMLPGAQPNQRELGIDVRLDRSLPAFTNCSLDGNPGNGEPKDGDPEGQSNLHLYWTSKNAVDRAGEWAMELYLADKAPKDECTVDVTPRRCQQFQVKPGSKVGWSNASLSAKKVLQSGTVTADASGLVTVPKVMVNKEGIRLTLRIIAQ